ncbi:MAG: DUF1616 domain-containing protein, partial [Dehalococcoidia bacterium]|nr:DUF1616 domain-containing protein [Dehalococcoidia bacterium]
MGRGRISTVERLGISLGLSIALCPLGLFLLNTLLDIPIDSKTTLVLVLAVALVGTLAAFWRVLLRARAATMTRLGTARQWGG